MAEFISASNFLPMAVLMFRLARIMWESPSYTLPNKSVYDPLGCMSQITRTVYVLPVSSVNKCHFASQDCFEKKKCEKCNHHSVFFPLAVLLTSHFQSVAYLLHSLHFQLFSNYFSENVKFLFQNIVADSMSLRFVHSQPRVTAETEVKNNFKGRVCISVVFECTKRPSILW